MPFGSHARHYKGVLTEATGKGVWEAGQGRGINRAGGDFRESAHLSLIPVKLWIIHKLGFRVRSNLMQKNGLS